MKTLILALAIFVNSEILNYELSFKNKIDSLFTLDSKQTFCTVINNKPPIYFASTFLTVELPFEQVAASFHDFKLITGSIGLIRTFNRINTGPAISQNGTYDFEAKISFCRGWALLDLDSFTTVENNKMILIMKGNDSPELVENYKKNHRGIFITKLDNLLIKFRIEKRTKNRTRIAFITWMAPQAYVPHWLYVIAADYAVPSVLNDIAVTLEKKIGTKND